MRKLEQDLVNAVAERDFLKLRCDSLLEEKSMNVRETSSQDKLFESLRLIQQGIDSSESSTKRKLTEDLEAARNECQYLRKQIEEQKLNNKETFVLQENSIRDLQQKLNIKEEESLKLQQDLSNYKSQAETIKQSNESLKEQTKMLDQKLSIVLSNRGIQECKLLFLQKRIFFF